MEQHFADGQPLSSVLREIREIADPLLQYVLQHPGELASYGTLLSSVVALLIVMLTRKQLRLNRAQLGIANAQLPRGNCTSGLSRHSDVGQ